MKRSKTLIVFTENAFQIGDSWIWSILLYTRTEKQTGKILPESWERLAVICADDCCKVSSQLISVFERLTVERKMAAKTIELM